MITVKHALQNTQNDCHQWLSHSFRVHQVHFRPGLHPKPRWGSLQRSPDSLAGLRGTLLLRGRVGAGEDRGRPPLKRIPGSAPSVRMQAYLRNYASNLHHSMRVTYDRGSVAEWLACWTHAQKGVLPWLGSRLAALRYFMYFRFYGRCYGQEYTR